MISLKQSSNVTFCTGYWLIADNRKRAPEHYLKYIPRTLKTIAGHNLLVFHEDDDVFQLFETHCRTHGINVAGIRVPVVDLPTYRLSEQMLDCCKAMTGSKYLNGDAAYRREKGRRRYQREYLKSGPENYRRIISIWTSKVPLVANHAIPANPFGSDYFAWIDASVARFRRFRSNWDFMSRDYDDAHLHHYGSSSYCMGVPLRLNASFLLAHRHVWPVVRDLYEQQLKDSLSDAYAHDEETIMSRVVEQNGALFSRIGSNYTGLRKFLYKASLKLEMAQALRLR